MEPQAKEKRIKNLNEMSSFVHIMQILYLITNNRLEVLLISIAKMDIGLLLNKLFFVEDYIVLQARKSNDQNRKY
jgi:hypothetical protein